MNILPEKLHGVWDFMAGACLLLVPNVAGFSEHGGIAELPPRLAGWLMIATAVATRQSLGLLPLISWRVHLSFDAVLGFALAISPWVFQLVERPHREWAPCLVSGACIFGVASLTSGAPRMLERLSGAAEESSHQ